MELFGTDGIRGVAGKFPLDTKTIHKVALAASKVLKKKHGKKIIVIGRDTRQSGTSILKDLADSISSCGLSVWDLGVITTPGVAYLTKKHKALSGIVISASHNPFEDNGIKFFNNSAKKLSDAVEDNIEANIAEQDEVKCNGKTKIKPQSVLADEYITFLSKSIPQNIKFKGVKVVIDCANGATYQIAPKLFSKLGIDTIVLNNKPTGKNINLNCGSLHPEILADAVKKNNALCGLAFDGDGDRVMFVDEKGIIRDGDYYLSIMAQYLKEKNKLKNNTLVTTVMANLGLFKAMKEKDINVFKTAVGDRYVFEGMQKSSAVIGGEQSGHIIFNKLLPTGDGILSGIQMLSLLAEKEKPLSELCSIMQKFPQILINTKVSKKIPVQNLPKTSDLIKQAEQKLGDNGRVLVRYSGTENLIRVMIEGQGKNEITNMANEISELAKTEIENI